MKFDHVKISGLNIFSENRILFKDGEAPAEQTFEFDEDGEKAGMAEARDIFDIVFKKIKVGKSSTRLANDTLVKENPGLDPLLKFALKTGEITNAKYDKTTSILILTTANGDISIQKGSDLFKAIFWPKEEPQIVEYPWQKQSGDLATDLFKDPATNNADELKRLEALKKGKTSAENGTEKPKFEIAVDGKDVEAVVGKRENGELIKYKIRIFAPKNWDGTLDVYLPGDTYTVDLATSSKHLRDKFIAKGQSGKMSALAVVEGEKSKIMNDKENRYADLKKAGSLTSILDTVGNNLGNEVSSINFMGHSRGGSALNYILQSGAEAAKISTISCLDSTYFSATPLIAFARRGGQLNIAFVPNPPKPPGTVGPAREVIRALGLTKIAKDHWASADGKVNVYETPGMTHSAVPDKYAGIFMGSDHHETRTYTVEQSAQAAKETYTNPEVQATPPGKLHFSFFEKTESAEIVTASKDDMSTLTSSDIEDIRFNSGLLTKTADGDSDEQKATNLKQETYRRMRAYTSTRDKEWFTVDYAKMGADQKGKSHEEFIGLGDILLDPDIKDILVFRGGEVIKAKRGIVGDGGKHAGRVGFLDSTTNQYVATHTGDKFRILTEAESNSAEFIAAMKAENSSRTNGRKSFDASPENYSDGAGYYAGKTAQGYENTPSQYGQDDTLKADPKKPRTCQFDANGKITYPPEVPPSERHVQMMGHKEALTYYERIMGRPPHSGWLLKGSLPVFGKTVNHPNIVLACMLKEMEYRCSQLGMSNLKFDNMSSTANKPMFHGLGMAIDFDATDNWVKTVGKTTWTIPPAFAAEMQKMGFKWGMYFNTSRSDKCTDAMHFDLRISLPNAMKMLTSPEARAMAQGHQIPGKGNLYAYAMSLDGNAH